MPSDPITLKARIEVQLDNQSWEKACDRASVTLSTADWSTILAALAGWQPIETAPKDEESYEHAPDILVATEAGDVFVSSWTKWNGGSFQWCNGWGREMPSMPDGTLFDPVIAWRPLPQPPEQTT